MDFQIVPLDSTHIEAVACLERLCFESPWTENNLRLLLRDNAIAFVCLIDGRVCGYCGALSVLDEADITSIAVHPAYRRHKIASALLSSLIKSANERAVVSLTLEVREGNVGACALYQKYNFVAVGRIKNYYKNPVEDAIIMKIIKE